MFTHFTKKALELSYTPRVTWLFTHHIGSSILVTNENTWRVFMMCSFFGTLSLPCFHKPVSFKFLELWYWGAPGNPQPLAHYPHCFNSYRPSLPHILPPIHSRLGQRCGGRAHPLQAMTEPPNQSCDLCQSPCVEDDGKCGVCSSQLTALGVKYFPYHSHSHSLQENMASWYDQYIFVQYCTVFIILHMHYFLGLLTPPVRKEGRFAFPYRPQGDR